MENAGPKHAHDHLFAVDRLRAYIVLIVLACHSFLAYCAFTPAARLEPFLQEPYAWVNYPMADAARWTGFDAFFLYGENLVLCSLFLVAGAFAGPSLVRKGGPRYLAARFVRLGAPFALAVVVLSPIAYYPSYALREPQPGLRDYIAQYGSLEFWSAGPLWFVAALFVLDVVAVTLRAVVPGSFALLARAGAAARCPSRFVTAIVGTAAAGYLVLSAAFGARWFTEIAFEQASRVLMFLLYYLAGIGIGLAGAHRTMLAPDGPLARRWKAWLVASLLPFAAYIACWLAIEAAASRQAVPGWLAARNVAHTLFGAAACMFALGFCARFAQRRSWWLASIGASGFGMYVIHYPFVTWAQYMLLDVPLPAIAKGFAALAFTILGSWAAIATLRRLHAAVRRAAARGIADDAMPERQSG